MTLSANSKVNHAKFGNGTVTVVDGSKAIVNFNGVEKSLIIAFSGLNEGHKELKAKKVKAAAPVQSNLQSIKTSLLFVNKKYKDNISIFTDMANKIGNVAHQNKVQWVLNIIDAATKHNRIDEKNAYSIARWADENGINA